MSAVLRASIWIAVVALGVCTISLQATSQVAPQATFRAGVRTVSVYATVQDSHGHLMTNLSRRDFTVREDGRVVPITVFSSDVQPITAAVLLGAEFPADERREIDSVRALIAALQTGDRIRLCTIGGSEINVSPHLTGDPKILNTILDEEMWFGLPAPFFRAMDAAMSSLEHETGRRVVLALSDSEPGSTSCLNCDDVPPALRVVRELPGGAQTIRARVTNESDFMVYAIGYAGRDDNGRLLPDVEHLADMSGGGRFDVAPRDDVGAIFTQLADELRHQYIIGFDAATDGREHKIEVRVASGGAHVRARTSYVAGKRP